MKKLKFIFCMLLCAVLVSTAVIPSLAIKRRDVDYSEDFTAGAYAPGTLIDDKTLDLHKFWTVNQFPNYVVAPCSVMTDDGDTRALRIRGYMGMLSSSEMYDKYTYSVDMRVPSDCGGGIAVSARHAAGSPKGPLYEADLWKENNGYTEENISMDMTGFLHDYSGIAVYPTATVNDGKYRVVIGVKTYVYDGKANVANTYYELYTPVKLTEYFNLFFEDADGVLKIFIDGNLICSVEMSDPGMYEKDTADSNEYFRHIVMKNAEGTEVMNIDNARLAVDARIAVTARNAECYIKGFEVISQDNEEAMTLPETEDTETEEITTEETTVETTAETTVETGTKTTDAGPTEAVTEAPGSTGTTDDGKSGGEDKVLFWAFSAVGVVLVVAILAVVFVKTKRGI